MQNPFARLLHSVVRFLQFPNRISREQSVTPDQVRAMLQEMLADPETARRLLKPLVGTAFPIQGGMPTPCTAGKIPKFDTTDNCSSLTDSVIAESSGNIGIGTTTPASKLHLAGSGPSNGIAFGDNGDVNLYRWAGGERLETQDFFFVLRDAAGSGALACSVSGDSQARFSVLANGTMQWSSGNAAVDTNLYRSAADTLRTADSLIVDGNVGIGTTSPAGILDIAGKTVFLKPSGGDDTSQINTAMSNLETNGGIIYLTPGLYLVTNLTGRSNIHLWGAGAGATTVKFNSGSGRMISFDGKSNFSVRHIKWDYNNRTPSADDAAAIHVGVNSDNFDISDCSIININNAVAPRFTRYGIQIGGGTNFRIERNYIQFSVNNVTVAISNAENNGAGPPANLIKITTAVAHGFVTGNRVSIQNVLGTTEANGVWPITVINTTQFTLDGSTFSNTYTSGGIAYVRPQNEAIHVFVGSGVVPKNGLINANHLDRSGMHLTGHDLKITKNVVHGFTYGAGITTEQEDTNCYGLQIVENTIYGGTGEDDNSTQCLGIENWARDSVIIGNICYDNDGVGMDQGGKRCTVANNICYDNSNGTDISSGQPVALPGISIRHAVKDSVVYSASESVFVGNRCFDTRAGGSKKQTYGIADHADCTDITIGVNNLLGNATGEANIQGSNYAMFLHISGGGVALSAPSSAPTDSDLNKSNISFYLDESGHNLKVRVKYSNGTTLKTATIGLT